MKTNLVKRYISFLLCVVMLIGVMPLSVMASNQKHVRITNIEPIPGKKDPAYEILMSWENPTIGNGDHEIEGFKIEKRKAVTGKPFEQIKEEKGKDHTSIKISENKLESGSIYEFKVTPYHMHEEIGQNGDKIKKPAPYEPSPPLETALFMTDIKVDARGYGNTLEVTFDNPTYDGKNIFTGYKIYYQQGGTTVKPDSFHSVVQVRLDNKDLIHSKDPTREVNRLTYRINDENIKPSNIYAVKVEPLYNNKEIRTDKTGQIVIDNKIKKISYNDKNTTQYRTDNAYVSIPLFVVEDGKDYLKLQWGDISGLVTVGGIGRIEILAGSDEDNINTIVGTIHGQTDIVNVNSWRIGKPTEKTYFKIKIYVGGQKPDLSDATIVESMIAMYDPAIVNVTPNKPNIYPKNNVANNKPVIDLYWDTFTRPPYNKNEESAVDNDGLLIDTNVVYDVWVTDSLKNLDRVGLPKIMDKVHAKDIEITNIQQVKNKVFYKQIKEYVTVDSTGSFLTKAIDENKTYYIKIIATKPTADGLGLQSLPAIVPIYVPSAGDISRPKALSRPPLRVKKDENGNDLITQTEINIEWNTKWFEVYDEATQQWYTNVAIRDGKLVYGKDVKDTDKIIDFYNKDSEQEVRLAFTKQGYTNAENLVIRHMDISSKDIQYEMIVVPFDEIDKTGGYEKYIETLLQSEDNRWQKIEPKFNGEKYAEHLINNLQENTTYAILLRPFRVLTDGKKEAYPTYLLATTLPKDTNIEVTPTIPTLYEVGKTDISIEVEWEKIANNVVYELAIDENMVEDPSKASLIIDKENIKANATTYNKEDKREFLKYNIKPLFPETGYYIWIRAIVDKTGKTSEWSTPIYVKTNSIIKPEPPSGFGLASEKSVSTYNANNKTDYKPITDKYLILEWLRDTQDFAEDAKSEKKGTIEPLLDKNIKKTYMVKFNELLPNKYYYARAKTKVYVVKGSDGSIEKIYSYIVELSPNQDFKDSFEIEIPKVEPKGDKVLTAESDWTTTYKYKTKFSTGNDGDYDGNIIDDLYPLPTQDFDIVYDNATQTLTYRFRSNKIDENGNADNLVDQRFITSLINNKVYNYNIDLTSHKGYKIKNRRVELPYSIISTFEQRKIALSITVGGTRFTLNPAFLNTSEVKSIGKMGATTSVFIDIMENPDNLPILKHNQIYATTPQYIKIGISNNGAYKALSYTGSNMDVFLKLKNRSLPLDSSVGAYRNINNNLWERVPSIYNSEAGTHTIKTNRLGKYTTISNKVNQTNISDNNNIDILTSVNNKIVFSDLTNVNTKSPISVVQFNNIVAGIASNKKEIAINEGLSDKDYQSLKRSGMLLQGSVVGREAGINTLVRLYEMKTKSKYEAISNINTTPYKDIKNANKAYQMNLIKAGDIGFYGEATNANPKAVMTIEEMLYMIDIILEDSGY